MHTTESSYKLKVPFDYMRDGLSVSATFVTLFAPTSRHVQQCADIKQAFFSAAHDVVRRLEVIADDGSGETDEDEDLTGDLVLHYLERAQSVNLGQVIGWFGEMAAGSGPDSPGVAIADGVEPMTGPLIESMSYEDLEAMTAEYIATFILASAWRKMRSPGSEPSSD